jgi:hypothetical protein
MTQSLPPLHNRPPPLFSSSLSSPSFLSPPLFLPSSSNQIPSLINLCIDKLIQILESSNYHPQQINELCKILSPFQHLLDPILVQLLQKKAITDVALIAFLVPDRHQLVCPEVVHIKNSTLKMIGYNCPNLVCDPPLLDRSSSLFSFLLSAFVDDIKSH